MSSSTTSVCMQVGGGRRVGRTERLLERGCRRDHLGRGLRGDLGVLEVPREGVGGRPELGVEVVVERRAVPVVDPADDLAVDEVDRGENPQLAAEELGRVGHVDERARLVGEHTGRVRARGRRPVRHVLGEDALSAPRSCRSPSRAWHRCTTPDPARSTTSCPRRRRRSSSRRTSRGWRSTASCRGNGRECVMPAAARSRR